VKAWPTFTAFAHFAKRVEGTGARALVLFNRFYQPDFDLETLSVVPTLSLSRPYEVLLRLHWVALLYGRVDLELALTGGVHSGKEAAKALLAGAQVAMMTSALLERGPRHFQTVLSELRAFMEEKGYESVEEMRGAMSYRNVAEPAALERANYLKVLGSYRLLP
jgi:dihydroorotate dehydrogenase (fumarate)